MHESCRNNVTRLTFSRYVAQLVEKALPPDSLTTSIGFGAVAAENCTIVSSYYITHRRGFTLEQEET